jgi:acetoacetate decarboxylase
MLRMQAPGEAFFLPVASPAYPEGTLEFINS